MRRQHLLSSGFWDEDSGAALLGSPRSRSLMRLQSYCWPGLPSPESQPGLDSLTWLLAGGFSLLPQGPPMCSLSILPTRHLSLLRAGNSNKAENEGERGTLEWKSMFLYNITISEAIYQHFCYIRFVRRVLLSPMDS